VRRRAKELLETQTQLEELQSVLARYEIGWPPGHFYSPLPDLDEVRRRRDELNGRLPAGLPGIELNGGGQLGLLRALGAFHADAPWADDPRPPLRYFYDNPNFRHGEAVVLYGLMRHLRPARIVEIGSGHSSCVVLDTNELFFDGSIECTFVEPYPELLRSLVREGDLQRATLLEAPLQAVGDGVFRALQANDILLVDSTHVAKVGSDVNRIVFGILPLLASGVYVHFHDVPYPFEYSEAWILEGRAWNEAYLLRAFLLYNDAFEVALFNSFLGQLHPDAVAESLPLASPNPGSSLWLRRR
jgi:Methyltransferase domain